MYLMLIFVRLKSDQGRSTRWEKRHFVWKKIQSKSAGKLQG